MMQVDLIYDGNKDVCCKRAIRGSDDPKMGYEEIVGDDINYSISEYKIKVGLCLAEGVQRYSEEPVERDQKTI